MNQIALGVRLVGRALAAKSPQILTGMAVAGMVSTTVLAVRVTPKAAYMIEHAEVTSNTKLTPQKKVKLVWREYIPAAAVGTVTIACIISANSVSNRRNAALMGLYTVTEKGFREYQEKVVETFGEQKEQQVRDKIAQDHIDERPVKDREVIIVGTGNVLCYDHLSGRYFQSDMETIRRAVNDINQKVINDMYASQNEFYQLIGLKPIGYGEEFGWSTDNMLDVEFSTGITEDGKPCLHLNFKMNPIRGYYTSFLD